MKPAYVWAAVDGVLKRRGHADQGGGTPLTFTVTNNPDGSLTLTGDGVINNADGSMTIVGDGAVNNPDGSMTLTDGA